MSENMATVLALAVAVLIGFVCLIMVVKRVIRTETVESIADMVRDMPVTMGSGIVGKIYEYSRAAVLTVEQLVKTGQIQPDDSARKAAAMQIVEHAAKVDEVPFGTDESEVASACIEASVQLLPRNQPGA